MLTGDDVETATSGEEAPILFEEAFDDRVTVRTRQVNRGRTPSTELVEMTLEADADRIVTGLGQPSRTERITFGSVARSLLRKVDRPTTLVPLPEYTVGGKA